MVRYTIHGAGVTWQVVSCKELVLCYMCRAGVTWQVIPCKEVVLCGMLHHVQSRCCMAGYSALAII